MARHTTWAALAVGVAITIGCGPAKELPNEIPKGPTDNAPASGVPAASQPEAKAYVERAVKAYTGGKPELVATGRASRTVLKGRQHKIENVPIEAVRTVAAVWPDRFFDRDEQQLQGGKHTITAYLHRPNLAVAQDADEARPSNAEQEREFASHAAGQYWMALLLPLTDPKAVVYNLRPGTFLPLGGKEPVPVQILTLSLGESPPYQLTFDAKTDLLLRVEYSYQHYGTTTAWAWSMADHKISPEGLYLPNKMELRFNNSVGEEWEVQKREFPAAIPDAEFSPPKK